MSGAEASVLAMSWPGGFWVLVLAVGFGSVVGSILVALLEVLAEVLGDRLAERRAARLARLEGQGALRGGGESRDQEVSSH